MDWQSIFLPDIPLLEIILRGSVMYIALFVLLPVTPLTVSVAVPVTMTTPVADTSRMSSISCAWSSAARR